jgi:hypothetical protein
MASNGCIWYLLIDPFPVQSIDLFEQQLKGILSWRGDFHGLSRSAISAIEELADRSNPGGLALCLQRQARELGDR